MDRSACCRSDTPTSCSVRFQEILHAFQQVDKTGTGCWSKRSILRAFSSLGFKTEEIELAVSLSGSVDANGNVNYAAVLDWIMTDDEQPSTRHAADQIVADDQDAHFINTELPMLTTATPTPPVSTHEPGGMRITPGGSRGSGFDVGRRDTNDDFTLPSHLRSLHRSDASTGMLDQLESRRRNFNTCARKRTDSTSDGFTANWQEQSRRNLPMSLEALMQEADEESTSAAKRRELEPEPAKTMAPAKPLAAKRQQELDLDVDKTKSEPTRGRAAKLPAIPPRQQANAENSVDSTNDADDRAKGSGASPIMQGSKDMAGVATCGDLPADFEVDVHDLAASGDNRQRFGKCISWRTRVAAKIREIQTVQVEPPKGLGPLGLVVEKRQAADAFRRDANRLRLGIKAHKVAGSGGGCAAGIATCGDLPTAGGSSRGGKTLSGQKLSTMRARVATRLQNRSGRDARPEDNFKPMAEFSDLLGGIIEENSDEEKEEDDKLSGEDCGHRGTATSSSSSQSEESDITAITEAGASDRESSGVRPPGCEECSP
eukprot:TRINITY_DN64764_c0_g1_i1.p1 TRINITY_DN64764_c0_g1~~TRINITY_DN64764_c0_g1_i1.p1  ORF type:complete len:560 (-),score=100.77 TRINITY_DN64764_c0_g1_i1:104-1735(-)